MEYYKNTSETVTYHCKNEQKLPAKPQKKQQMLIINKNKQVKQIKTENKPNF